MEKRYHICKFPSYYGTPWETDNYWLALLYFYTRGRFSSKCYEVRLIDKQTHKHKVRYT